jgi:hypothetical protein
MDEHSSTGPAEVTPEMAHELAIIAVQVGAKTGFNLDFSVNSARKIDEAIDIWRREGLSPEMASGRLIVVGCYLGEILVIHGNAKWVVPAEVGQAVAFDDGVAILELPDGRGFCNPIGKALKRHINGVEDSVELFVLVILDICRKVRPAPSDSSLILEWSRSHNELDKFEAYSARYEGWTANVFRLEGAVGWAACLYDSVLKPYWQEDGMTLFLERKLAQEWCYEEIARRLGGGEPAISKKLDVVIKRAPVRSSNVASVGHDPNRNILDVEFRDGSLYRYFGVPTALFLDLVGASSIGSFLATEIKGIYRFERL